MRILSLIRQSLRRIRPDESSTTTAPGGTAQRIRGLPLIGIAAAGGYLASMLGYLLVLPNAGIVFLWPPSGLVLAALLVLPRRDWPAVVVGASLGNFAADLQHGSLLLVALGGGTMNGLEHWVAAMMVVTLAGRRPRLTSLRDVGALVLGVVVVSNAVTAIPGAFVILQYQSGDFGRAWLSWWTGDGMGVLTLTPVVLTWLEAARSRRATPRQAGELLLLLLAVAVVGGLLLRGGGQPGGLRVHAYLVFPLLIWAGVRFGPPGATAATLVLTGVTAAMALTGAGLFSSASPSPERQVFEIYTYLALAGVSALVPAAMLAERLEVEVFLRESERRFRELADHINEAFFVIDVTTQRPLYVSPSWAGMWGHTLEEAYDPQVWLDAVHPDDLELLADARRATAAGDPRTIEFRIRRPDGSTRWLRDRAFPVRDESGAVGRIVGVTADVTEVRDAEQRFVQAQKMEAVGRLAGGVAHDFNNVLTVFFAEAYYLETRGDEPAQREESIRSLRAAAESGAALTRQILAFTRRQVVEPRIFDVDRAISSVSRMLERVIGADVELALLLDADGAHVRADPGQFEQVLVNLVVNARDAMSGGGAVTIETSHVPDPAASGARGGSAPTAVGWVRIVVRDDGPGVPADVLPRVFEPFFTTKKDGRGTGLGLATCQAIVEQAGGRIGIESTPDVGTSIEILLPPAVASAKPAEVRPARAHPRGIETILVVEDDWAVRRSVVRILAELGYVVIEADDATKALRETERTHPDLLLTDIVLPGMSGPDLAQRVHIAYPDTSILFVSGHVDDVVLGADLMAKGAKVLRKPFAADELARRVRDALDRDARADRVGT